MTKRDQKLAELADIAHGIRWGIAAFDNRLEEMGPGPAARGNGRGGKGGHSDPVYGEVCDGRRPVTVTSDFDRLLDQAHAAVLKLEAAYRPIAQPVKGLPSGGEPSCTWCDEAARSWRAAALKEGDQDAAERSPVAVHRCKPYLFAKHKVDNGTRVVKVLVCKFCYQFNLPSNQDRRPTDEELWRHAQGQRVLIKPGRKPKMKAAKRIAANAR